MRTPIDEELSRLARYLAKRDGYDHTIVNGGPTYRVLVLPEVVIATDEEDCLNIHEQDSAETFLYRETSYGHVEMAAPYERLRKLVNYLRRFTVLDDLASI
jgi:hypothetical protein